MTDQTQDVNSTNVASEQVIDQAVVNQAAPIETVDSATSTSTDAPSLSVNDLSTIINIIDAVTSRGAFKAGELQTVGEIYNKLTSFVAAVAESQGQNQNQGS